MGFTDNCDLYGAVGDGGVNTVIRDIMRQRPSLFNYATADVAANRKLWCAEVSYTPDVPKYHNPFFTILDPLTLPGADAPPVSVGFCAQLTKAEVDFSPGNTIQLPAELDPPLKDQQFALAFQLCGSIECPFPNLIDQIPVSEQEGKGTRPPIMLPGSMQCFCLDFFAVGHVERDFILARECLLGKIDAMDIVDIEPKALEDNIVCFIKSTVNVVLREKLTIALETLMLSFPLFHLITVTLTPTPDPPIPHNPAVEDDQVKVFITIS